MKFRLPPFGAHRLLTERFLLQVTVPRRPSTCCSGVFSPFGEVMRSNSLSKIATSRGASLLFVAIVTQTFLYSCWAQDLAPRAYLITPLHSNAVNLTYSFFHGGLDFNGVVPITGATGTYS